MFDIYDFIDSKDIREYNKQLATKFTPMEQAVLIGNSTQTTVEEKLAAWHELLDTYNAEDFSVITLPVEGGKCNIDVLEESSYFQLLNTTVKSFENALLLKNDTDNIVYKVSVRGVDPNKCIFSAYDKAYEYMCRYLHYISAEQTARISAVPLDDPDISRINRFIFDSKGRMTEIMPDTKGEYGLDVVYIYVPLPFVKGDILRSTDGSDDYIIVHRPTDREYFKHARDSSDMRITAYCINQSDGVFYNDFGHYNIFALEKCTEDDLPTDSKNFNKDFFLKLREDVLNDTYIRFF